MKLSECLNAVSAHPKPAAGFISDLLQLLRLRLSAMIALSALAGYLLVPQRPGWSALPLTLGVFLLAGSGSALNQLLERSTDLLMERTRNRPLASGRMHPRRGLAIGLLSAAAALTILTATFPPLVAGTGILSLACYGAYTLLKPHSAFALLPGALCGALPPLMGWFASGNHTSHPDIVVLAGLFFLWQIPHFWLICRSRGEEYARAGLPMPPLLFGDQTGRRLLSVWISCFIFSALPPLLHLASFNPSIVIPPAGALALLLFSLIRSRHGRDARLPLHLNLSLGLVTTALVVGNHLHRAW